MEKENQGKKLKFHFSRMEWHNRLSSTDRECVDVQDHGDEGEESSGRGADEALDSAHAHCAQITMETTLGCRLPWKPKIEETDHLVNGENILAGAVHGVVFLFIVCKIVTICLIWIFSRRFF